jgi:hypothetical protein
MDGKTNIGCWPSGWQILFKMSWLGRSQGQARGPSPFGCIFVNSIRLIYIYIYIPNLQPNILVASLASRWVGYGGLTFLFWREFWRNENGGSDKFSGVSILEEQLAIWPTYFKFGNSVVSPHWAFACCHVATHDWAMWQPLIGPHHQYAQSLPCHHYLVSCMDSTWMYGLPHGTFPLVHGLMGKGQK